MTPEENAPAKSPYADRRRAERFATSLDIEVRFSTDGAAIKGSCLDIASSGLRLLTPLPLVEATLVLVSFQGASNNTHCEGRVVWTQRSPDLDSHFESGVDVHRWGGSLPMREVVKNLQPLQEKKDRRKRPR